MPPSYGTTAKRALRYLLGSNLVRDVDAGFQALAEDVDTQLGSRGKSIVATSETRSSASYGLMPTPDRVQGVVVTADSLLFVAYKALWKAPTSQNASAAIFIGSNQLKTTSTGAPITEEATLSSDATPNFAQLISITSGLLQYESGTSDVPSDVTTGQTLAIDPLAPASAAQWGGPCFIENIAAGTYDISIQFKSSGAGALTVKERKLWVWVLF